MYSILRCFRKQIKKILTDSENLYAKSLNQITSQNKHESEPVFWAQFSVTIVLCLYNL